MRNILNRLCRNKKLICFISFALTAIFIVIGYKYGIFTDENKMQSMLSKAGLFAPLLFILIQAIQVVIPILPGAMGCAFGVVFFGAFKGFIYNYIGICIGSVTAFVIARACGREFVKAMTGKHFFSKYSHFLLTEDKFEKLFALLIFLPLAPDDFLCYLAGISNMSLKKFTLIILLGKPLAIFLYSMGLYKLFQFGTTLIGG